MKRFGQLMIGLAVVLASGVPSAFAQTTDGKWSVQFDAAATLGHTSSGSFGGEVDRQLTRSLQLAFEIGHMNNVTTQDLQDRAAIIGDQIGATANPIQSALYWDFGIRLHPKPASAWNPYVAVGFGGAHVKTDTTFSVNGTALTPDELAAKYVALGADLAGTVDKAFLLVGGGVQRTFKRRFFLDGSYRYGYIFPRTSEIDGDTGVNTQRIQIGIGFRF